MASTHVASGGEISNGSDSRRVLKLMSDNLVVVLEGNKKKFCSDK